MPLKITYKLPQAFVDAHKALLDGQDWERSPSLRLAEVLPDIEALAGVELEAVPQDRRVQGLKVRSVNTASMVALRRYADGLAES